MATVTGTSLAIWFALLSVVNMTSLRIVPAGILMVTLVVFISPGLRSFVILDYFHYWKRSKMIFQATGNKTFPVSTGS
jgi:hypothetical protein